MEKEQFDKQYEQALHERLGEEVTLRRTEALKVNEPGNRKEAISVHYPGSQAAPSIYLDDEYRLYQDGYSIPELIDRQSQMLEAFRSSTYRIPEINRETAQENLYSAVVNAEENAELLKSVPHRKIEDIAVIARFRVDENGSFLVTNEMCSSLKMTSEEILEQALKNTNKQEFECKNMNQVIADIMREQGMPEEYIDDVVNTYGQESPIYVLTTKNKTDGAAALASREQMQKAYDKIKEDHPDMKDMYVIPSSRHEILLIPDTAVKDAKDLKTIHAEVQAAEVATADKLSKSVYKCAGMSNKITAIITVAEHVTEKAVNFTEKYVMQK